MAAKIVHVVHHRQHGVFLGVKNRTCAGTPELLWHKDPVATRDSLAPVFVTRADLEAWLLNEKVDTFPVGVELQEVWARTQDGYATPEECAAAGLPTWG